MSLARLNRLAPRSLLHRTTGTQRRLNSYVSAYSEKIKQRTQQTGKSLEELKIEGEGKLENERRAAAAAMRAMLKSAHEADVASSGASTDKNHVSSRKDSSPVKPLSDILRLPKIAKAKPEQVSALWTAYHASRSEGTGRGYLCASIPLPIYEKMSAVGAKYPTFVVPLARPDVDEPTNTEKMNYEFYFMQWNFHEAPPVPSTSDDPFDVSGLRTPSPNPPTSTIIFTPLQEYKLRQSFATPYLILTHYTDLAHSHGQVLLRGEITPTTAGSGYMLAQEDAQRLAMSLQQFYVWGNKDGGPEGEQLLTKFHTQPEEFKWEDLVKFYNQAP